MMIMMVARCEDTRAQLNTEIKEREEAEAEVENLSFSVLSTTNKYSLVNCCMNIEKGGSQKLKWRKIVVSSSSFFRLKNIGKGVI